MQTFSALVSDGEKFSVVIWLDSSLWKAGSPFPITISNFLADEKKDESSEKKEGDGETKGAGAGLYIGIIFGVLVIGAAGVFLFWKFVSEEKRDNDWDIQLKVYKKRQDAKKTTKKEEGTSKKSSKKVESKSGAGKE